MNQMDLKLLQATDSEREKLITIYKDYSEFPYISPQRDITAWLNEVDLSSNAKVPQRNMIRTSEGLLPGHVILLWRISHGNYTSDQWVTKYFEFDYGIDAATDIEWLKEEGFVRLMTGKESLSHATAPFLKKLLKEKGIRGYSKLNKEDLVEQIKEYFTEEELKEKLSVFVYALTDKGQRALKDNQGVIDKHPKKPGY